MEEEMANWSQDGGVAANKKFKEKNKNGGIFKIKLDGNKNQGLNKGG